MKKSIIALATLLVFISQANATQNMQDLVDNKCGICHLSGIMSKEKLKNFSAPPMWGVTKKVKLNIASKENQVKFIVDFVMNPSKEKMMFPKETVDRFGYMPSQKGNLTQKEATDIANYLLSK